MNTIRLGDLITASEAKYLRDFVNLKKKAGVTTHNAVMSWLSDHPKVLERFEKHKVLDSYGAYLLEYYLKL